MLLAAAVPAMAQSPVSGPSTQIEGPALRFDWPNIEVGIASYEEGPTGVTVFRFPKPVAAVVDVRGGAPGTVNTDALRLGADEPFLDALVFTGGSIYGESAITGASAAFEDLGLYGTNWGDIAFVAGAVIYDFQGHRLNDIRPDEKLARAALQTLRPGVFPLGAQGAGRMAMQGSFFGCGAHSGQGGAVRTVRNVRIAAFVVVNAAGSITDRAGTLVKCHRDALWQNETNVSRLLARVGAGTLLNRPGSVGPTHNTTLSLIVTNQRMNAFELQRLAIQVHTSMARAIQPFSTEDDGDTLFAASTQELPSADGGLTDIQIDTLAGETMWDAILASVPDDEPFVPQPKVQLTQQQLKQLTGRYQFGRQAQMQFSAEDGVLVLRSSATAFFDIPHDRPVALTAQSATQFYIEGRYATRVKFVIGRDGAAIEAVINPGRWAQHGRRLAR